MGHSINTRSLILGAVAALLLAVAIPSAALAQGHGHGNGKGRGNGDSSNRIERDRSNQGWRRTSSNWPNYNKKCGKFVNCHDARNGRIDGRGPRGTSVGNVWSNRLRNRRYVNNDNLVIRNRSNNNFWRNRNRRNLRRVTDNR